MTPLTPPAEIAAWLACATFAVVLFNQLSRAWFTLRGKPTPIEQAAATSAIRERVSALETSVVKHKAEQDRRLDKLEKAQEGLRDLILKENNLLYNRINACADACAAINGEIKLIEENSSILLKTVLEGKK
ncbi:MAG TPA: hypothetical protein PLZ74_01735 [Kiritimatiellia bacterium]|jgi:hypothetical protein|nr:hypothetical protein [Kiritimatiellia bacterium]